MHKRAISILGDRIERDDIIFTDGLASSDVVLVNNRDMAFVEYAIRILKYSEQFVGLRVVLGLELRSSHLLSVPMNDASTTFIDDII